MYVCLCNGITDTQIRDAVDSGAESLRAVRKALGVANQCGKCASMARDIVRDTLDNNLSSPSNTNFYEVA